MAEEAVFKCDLKQLYLEFDIYRDANSDIKIMLDTLGKRKCFPETLEILENLHKKYRIVIGSTTDQNPLYRDLERNGLAVDAVYTSEMIRKYKPAPEFYQYILQNENCDKEDAVFVGDSYLDDVYGPYQVGIKSILIDRKHTFSRVQNEPKPWKITDSLKNITDLLSDI